VQDGQSGDFAVTREEMQRVLGKGGDELLLDMLKELRVADIGVVHTRPICLGKLKLEKGAKLRPVLDDDGGTEEFTGAEMAAYRRHFVPVNSGESRFYFSQYGGRTTVTLRVGDKDFVGEARCSDEDLFVKEEGRRVALVRAIIAIGGKASERLGLLALNPKCTEYSVAGPRPKPRLGTGDSSARKSFTEYLRLFEGDNLSLLGSGGFHFVAPIGSLWDQIFNLGPEHVRLERRALRELEEARSLDAMADRAKGKKAARRLREKARAVREQAHADAAVSAQIRPYDEDQSSPAIRNEA
jgi:hypothetical protein